MAKRRRRKIKYKAVRRLAFLLILIITCMVLVVSFVSTKNNNKGYDKLENEVIDLVKVIDNNTLDLDDLKVKYKTKISKSEKVENSLEEYLLDIANNMDKVNKVKNSEKYQNAIDINNLKKDNYLDEMVSYFNEITSEVSDIKTELTDINGNNYLSSENLEYDEYINIIKNIDKDKYIKDIDKLLEDIESNKKIITFLKDNTKNYEINEKITFFTKDSYNSFKDIALDKIEYELKEKEKVVNKDKYYTEVIRNQNTVIVYGLDSEGEYTKIVKVFPCSVGKDNGTPTGTFKTTDKYVWRALFGGVYGQYATRINGSILFHSVPYTAQSKNSLEWDEYNKLGTAASMGCVRMAVADVKWIYDNCPSGMTVKIYDGELPKGVTKPTATKIDSNSPNKGWDPTDPDSNNPWNKN